MERSNPVTASRGWNIKVSADSHGIAIRRGGLAMTVLYSSFIYFMKVFAILGHPVTHSLSPKLHNSVFHELGLEDRTYEFCDTPPEKLEAVLEELRKGKYSGFSVTIPYKQEVMKYLEEISERAKKVGSVNTILSREDGTLFGDNTDYVGFAKSLEEEGVLSSKFQVPSSKALVLGSGGVAQAVIEVLHDHGYQVTVATRGKGTDGIPQLRSGQAPGLDGLKDVDTRILLKNYDELDPNGDYQMIVNTTPVGMHPHVDQTPLEDEHWFKKDRIFVDVIYNPKKTLFLKKAEQGGAKIITGDRMFLWQAVEQAKYFCEREEVPVEVMEKVLIELLIQK
jgi:shikimate dehydrogenase